MSQPQLIDLLPAIMQLRDTELGRQVPTGDSAGPLHELLTIIGEQVDVVAADIEQLYDDQFIETCAEWVIAYLGDLVGVKPGNIELPPSLSRRALVANSIAYRRRKGTVGVLEQVARDASGWPARAVEFFARVATTQSLNHIRPQARTVDLRQTAQLQLLDTPFSVHQATVEVGRIGSGRGQINLPNIGLFVWRLKALSVTKIPATLAGSAPDHGVRYRFDPLGADHPLFNNPRTERDITRLAGVEHVPAPLSRYQMAQALATYYGPGRSVAVWQDEALAPLASIAICNLAGEQWGHPPADRIAIDPQTGRLVVPAAIHTATTVRVSYYRGFAAEIGGGEYDRYDTLVVRTGDQQVVHDSGTLQDALAQARDASSVSLVQLASNEPQQITEDLHLPAARALTVQSGNQYRPVVSLPAGGWRISGAVDSELELGGLLFTGGGLIAPRSVQVENKTVPNQLQSLRLSHCTIAPGGRLVSELPINLVLDHCLVGSIELPPDACLTLKNCIVDAGSPDNVAIAGPGDGVGPLVTLQNCTIVGRLHLAAIDGASNCIFHARAGTVWPNNQAAPLLVRQKQRGCVQFCYLPALAVTPRRVQCITGDVLANRPVFTSQQFGNPGYMQLHQSTATTIRRGADDGSEMGVFHDLYQPQREDLLHEQLPDYLRFGLETGLYFVT